MGSNAKRSGKWASKEIWKCVVIHKERRTRTAFYSNTEWAAKADARKHLKVHKYSLDDYEISTPVEVFK